MSLSVGPSIASADGVTVSVMTPPSPSILPLTTRSGHEIAAVAFFFDDVVVVFVVVVVVVVVVALVAPIRGVHPDSVGLERGRCSRGEYTGVALELAKLQVDRVYVLVERG